LKGQIDDLTYQYSGNQLTSVTDDSDDYNGYPDVSGIAIPYDDNGNMKDHKDKGTLEIRYNYLNLPDYVKFDKTYIPRFGGLGDFNVNTQYLYRADGTKLRKIYTFGTGKSNMEVSTTTDYLDGFQYEIEDIGGSITGIPLKFVPTAEGYYNFENNQYIYSYTDHLGNVRLSYFKNANGSAEVLEENNFYPFGLKHEGYNTQIGNPAYNYQYNGKELQRETGWSDYGARMYMSDIGRWGVIDPLAETSRRFTPYNYAYNNPISFTDPDGRKPMSWDDEQKNIMTKNAPDGSLWWAYASGGSMTDATGDGVGDFFGQMKMRNGTGGGNSASADANIQTFLNNGVSYERAVEVSQNGAISFTDYITSGSYFQGINFSQFGNDSPDDVIIRNKKGHIMYRILSKKIYKDVRIDTDVEINNPMTINLADYEKMGAHAVGFSLDYSATLGGGMNGGFTFVYFMGGGDAGSGYVYGYTGGNSGFESSIGISKFYATFVDKQLLDNFNAEGYAGKSSGHSFGVGIWGYSRSWGNRTNDGELWQGQKSKTTWITISNGVAHGQMGGKVFWSNYTILKKVF
jgi:RHS repeat-associated protein